MAASTLQPLHGLTADVGSLKAIVTPQSLLVLDFRGLGLERWLVLDLAPQLASQTHSLPFEFRALEGILQHKVNTLQARLNDLEPVILDTLESLIDSKILSADRSKLHILLQNSKSEESSLGIDHAEEMELLLENYYMQAEALGNKARELKGLIDDSESVIFINLDSHRNVMMRLNLQLTMGSFSLTLFGLIGVAFGMNLTSNFEEDPRVFWLVTGFMFLGSGLIWRRLLSFLGRYLDPSVPTLLFVSSQSPHFTTDDMYLEGQTSGDLPIDDEDREIDGSGGSGSGDYIFTHLTNEEERLMRFLNFSRTTVSKEMVPSRPQPTVNSPHEPPTTAAESQATPTTTKDTEKTTFIFPEGDKKVVDIGPTADFFTESTTSTSMPPSETASKVSVTKDTEEDNSLDRWDVSTPRNTEDVQIVDNEIMAENGRIYHADSPKEVTSENLWERTEVLAAVIACGVVGFLCAVFLLLLLAYRMKKKDEGSYDLGDTKLSTTTYQKAPTKEFYA
ncbi:Magnesium transporter MRS2-like protein [Nibea albiflora]|uniref:Magnesium transporter MRS2-like protein n=1 Tax=Nibea albiflora TaxID=240163 RepID=A0ACB7F7N9_NIBAL|nr:Magnesium transporter MRS2-like protein [Nibea albiflora]